jgi:endonuclease/exonuclease/phosphatase family metal-dependent hydrolase
MFYSLLRTLAPREDRTRAVGNLTKLRAQLDEEVPAKDAESELLLATWNIRDLGKPENKRRGWGPRSPESYFYIAEVLSRFDFIAVQEVNELEEWKQVMRILGPDWDWIATDVTDEDLGGNGERLTYLWDKRKVNFQHVAGELVLPTRLLITKRLDHKDDKDSDGRKDKPDPNSQIEIDGKPIGQQFRRTPFAALFQAAWFKFEICTAHLYYGEDSGEQLEERIEEIERIGEFFGQRAKQDIDEDRSLILLGDFNIVSREHKMMEGLLKAGFSIPKALSKAPPTNSKKTMYYDQIVFQTRKGELDYLETDEVTATNNARAGAVDLYRHLYTPDQRDIYKAQMETASSFDSKKSQEDPEAYFLEWRTYQFSDHFPLWVRLRVNDSESYLQSLVSG